MKKIIILSMIFIFASVTTFAAETKPAAKPKPKQEQKVEKPAKEDTTQQEPKQTKQTKKTEKKMTEGKKEIAVIETNLGTIKFEFLKDKAPKTCENFIKLAKKGFYDGLIFHRVIPNFMIQGGCPDGTGMGGPGYHIKAEFNDTKHVPGIVSMARSMNPDSAGSQFFICVATCPHLDRQYTAFGKVIEGYDVVEKISKVKTQPGDKPVEPVIMKKITIETE